MGQTAEKSRLDWLDLIKGILALCVILSHTEGTPELYHVIDSFMLLPGFFIVSGFVTRIDCKQIGRYFGQRVLKLFILYVIWSYIPPFLRASNWKLIFADPRMILTILINKTKSIITGQSLWFVESLLVVMVFFGILVFVTRNHHIIMGIISFILLWIGLIFAVPGRMLNWSADTALVGQFFFIAGYFMNQKGLFQKKWILEHEDTIRTIVTWLYIAVLALGTIFVGKISINMALNTYHNIFMTFIGFLVGNAMLLLWARKIGKNKFLCYVGRHSLIYFAIGSMETERFMKVFLWLADKTGSPLLSNHYFINPLIVLLCGLLTMIPCLIIDKWIPFLNGGFKLFTKKVEDKGSKS